MSPAKAYRLIPELGADVEGTGCGGGVDHVARGAAFIREVGIVERIADDCDVSRGRLLVKAAGEQAIVFEIADGGEQPGGDVVMRVAEDGLEDLYLLRAW